MSPVAIQPPSQPRLELRVEAAEYPPQLLANLATVNERVWRLFTPPRELKISEWAEQNIYLPPEVTVRPGMYVPEKFQRIIMDAMCDPRVRKVSCMKSTQVGWTQILAIIDLYYMTVDPKPQMTVFVRDSDAEEKSKTVYGPMIANCPDVNRVVAENKSRNGGNTILQKFYPGGDWKAAGANSAANLRSSSRWSVKFDEVDGYPDDVDGEGSPITIGDRRMDAYVGEEKALYGSTPAKPKGLSTIERITGEGDETYFHLPCPHCGEYQPLLWRDPETKEFNLYWDRDETGQPIKSSVRYRCRKCRQGIEERWKQWMLDRTKEVSKHPERVEHRSFYINALYSPWGENWHLLADEWQKAQGKPELLRAFINLRLGETWDEGADRIEPSALMARRERYDLEASDDRAPRFDVPMGAAVLVATVDVQQDRLEAQLKAFGAGEEEWLIDYEIFYGSTALAPGDKRNEDLVNVWADLDDWLMRKRRHESGADLPIDLTLIDTGYATDACYNFILPRQNKVRRVFACKGQEKLAGVGLVKQGSTKNDRIRLYNVATAAIKTRIMDRLRINRPGPAYMHYPMEVGETYFAELTAESRVPQKNKKTGITTYIWFKNQPRNEALDLTVYAHAALWILQKLGDRAQREYYGDIGAIIEQLKNGHDREAVAPQRRVVSRGLN